MSSLDLLSSPVNRLRGAIGVPGDKSISHRAIIFGAIAKGTTTIKGFLDGDDCLATLRAFQSMGVKIEGPVTSALLFMALVNMVCRNLDRVIDCGNSGTSMRLLAGLLAAQNFDSELTGDESLLKRPMERISRPLTQMGADYNYQ